MGTNPDSRLLSQAARTLEAGARSLPPSARSELRDWAEGFTRGVAVTDEHETARYPADATGGRPGSAVATLMADTLEAALSLTGTDRGNIQLVDTASGALTIAAQTGFDVEFLEYFATVDDDHAACGRAARLGAKVVIPDVTRDPGFAPHRDIAAASGFRAVQSTPLIGPTGVTLGVVSTHFRQPHTPSAKQQRSMAFLGQLVGAALAPYVRHRQRTAADCAADSAIAALTADIQTWLRSLGPEFVGVDQLTRHAAAGRVFANVIAAYLVTADESAELRAKAAQLERALASRVVIEQAKGVIAATNSIGVDEAFHVLRQYARNHNATIHAAAYAVVHRGLRP